MASLEEESNMFFPVALQSGFLCPEQTSTKIIKDRTDVSWRGATGPLLCSHRALSLTGKKYYFWKSAGIRFQFSMFIY